MDKVERVVAPRPVQVCIVDLKLDIERHPGGWMGERSVPMTSALGYLSPKSLGRGFRVDWGCQSLGVDVHRPDSGTSTNVENFLRHCQCVSRQM